MTLKLFYDYHYFKFQEMSLLPFAAVTAYPRLRGSQTTEISLSQFWGEGNPRP